VPKRQGQYQAEGEMVPRWLRVAFYLRDHWTCLYCGRDMTRCEPGELTLDHITPQSRGGTTDNSNLVTCCRSCNSRKQDKPWRQFAAPEAVRRITNARRRALNLPLARSIVRAQRAQKRAAR
jgi:5-methylcytosine-specific restriction endonuclease McrA